MKKKTFLIKANGRLVGKALSKEELRTKALTYEQTIKGRFKKEFCKFDEADGMHFGYDFTLFDVEYKKKLAELEQFEDGLYEDFEREIIDLDALNFELEGISLTRSLILNESF